MQFRDPDFAAGANDESLNEARARWKEYQNYALTKVAQEEEYWEYLCYRRLNNQESELVLKGNK